MTHYCSRLDPRIVIFAAAFVAALMALESQPAVLLGAGLTLPLIALAAQSSWLGLLALFPLAFAIRPAPPSIGVQEATFALLAGVIMLKSLAELGAAKGWRGIVRRYGKPVMAAALLGGVNLAVALSHHVAPADWLRGLVPFLFLVLALPLAQALEAKPERLRWLGLSVAALSVLMAGHVVLYFLWHGLNQPYWLVGDGVSARRIPETLLAEHPGAIGPRYERITMLLSRATDALLPGGLVIAAVVAVRANDRRLASAAVVLAFICLAALLMTYTRSMLLVAAFVLLLFAVCVSVCWRARLPRTLTLLGGLAIGGAAIVLALGIEPMWGHRMGQLAESTAGVNVITAGANVVTADVNVITVDVNVATRLVEFSIAWQRFLDHPLLGNGLGAKHAMRFYSPEGVIEQQVAYIHNWPLYALMATGMTGFVIYAWVLLAPALTGWRAIRNEPLALTVVRAGVLAFAAYALIFAVFRLISFNLLLAAAWGVVLAARAAQVARDRA